MSTYNGIEVVKFADGALYWRDVRETERHWINATLVTAIENEILERLGWWLDRETGNLVSTETDGGLHLVVPADGEVFRQNSLSGSVYRYYQSLNVDEPQLGETWILYDDLGEWEAEAKVIEHNRQLWFLYDISGVPVLDKISTWPAPARRQVN